MDIKGVEHQDVSKKKFNVIQLSKRYTKVGNETLDFFKQRLQEKYDFLDKVKKKNNKLRYLKEVNKVKKHDKMRLRKIKKTEPFPLFSSKYFKNTKYIFKQAKPLAKETDLLNYNRILFVHNIYQKLHNKYYYNNNKLKKYAKKKKKFLN